MPITPDGPGTGPGPYTSRLFRIGQDGLNIRKSLDVLTMTECSRLINVVPTTAGQLQTRPGATLLASGAGVAIHSIKRLNDPKSASFTRFYGGGTTLGRGINAFTALDSGYSGSPLIMLPHRPPLASSAYMFVADTAKMSKTSLTGPTLPIGLPKPSGVTTAIGATSKTAIAAFDSGDGSQAANWTGHAEAGATIGIIDDTGIVGNCVVVQSNWGTTTGDYTVWATLPKVLDLSKVGAITATDDDIVHIRVRIDLPQNIVELRFYLLCSSLGGGPIYPVPGTTSQFNTAAYMRAVRPADFGNFVADNETSTDAATTSAINTLINPPSSQSALGANVFTEFGAIGLPLRRSDFTKIGTAGQAGTDWSTISALFIWVRTKAGTAANVGFDDAYLTGGSGPDSSEPGASKYDYRVTNYDPRTGAESNPSDVQATTAFLDSLRQPITVTPAAYSDGNIRQRIYRRGGTITDDWYFVGTNTANGAAFSDTLTDAAVLAAGAVEIDHDQPVTTVDASGNTVFNQPLSAIWGPVDALIMGCGDPYRPGDVYWCRPGEPDHWPAANHVEVCSPSEELIGGAVYGGQAFVLSRERGYMLHTNLASTSSGVVATPTDCVPGAVSRWGIVSGVGGIYYIARDGIRATKGGESTLLSDPIKPLFHQQSANGLLPVDFAQPTAMRLEIYDNDLWFIYKDTGGTLQCLLYSLLYQNWRQYTFASPVSTVAADQTTTAAPALILGSTIGSSYTFSEASKDDAGTPISCQVRSGSYDFGYPHGDTLFSDVIVDADMQGATLTLTTLVNNETTTNTPQTVAGLVGRRRYIFEPFGTSGSSPQKARNIALDLTWTATATQTPVIEFAGVSAAAQPNTTMNRITQWDTPGDAECYLTGVWLDCDTGTSPRTVLVEFELNGVVTTAATLTVNPSGLAGRHKWWFSWSVVKASMIRLRPADSCVPWELYGYQWLQQAEPPRISKWDTNWESKSDTYYTGVDIECDTFGANKTVQFFADQTLISTQTVNANGRRLVHITLTPGRAHLYRFVATDGNDGLLYKWTWITEPEPGEQTNWNQNYTIAGTLADKWLKGALIQCDTFGLDKTVTFEVDGVVVASPTVNASGRKVVEVSFPQAMGRVFRMIPTDSNPGRLYSMQWIFDEEPLSLTRWETQEVDHGINGWQVPITANVTIKSSAPVTLTITAYGESGTVMNTSPYTLASTAGVKQKLYVPFNAVKGVLFKYVFTSASPFWLYRSESLVMVRPWNSASVVPTKPFGDDDLDGVRANRHAALMGADSGGGLQRG